MVTEPTIGDAFGATLMACYEAGMEPGSVYEIIERDDGFIDVGDAARYFSPDPAQWNAAEQWAIGRVRGRTLDVGCGAGRHSLALKAAGVDVTAIDVSPLAVEVCRRRGLKSTFVGYLEAFVATGPLPFETFLMLGNNLGLLAGQGGPAQLFTQIEAIAAPGARVVGTVFDPYLDAQPEHRAYHQRNRERGHRAGTSHIRARYRALATEWFDYMLATVEELAELLQGTGWRIADSKIEGPNQAVVLVRA